MTRRQAVLDVTGSHSDIVFLPLPTDDPTQRRPDISLAGEVLGWHAEVALRKGLELTAAWFAGTGERPPVAATTVPA